MTDHTKPSGALRSLRARNRSLVIDVLRHEGSASRAEIARRTRLTPATISSLVADLQREGLVVEGRTGPGQPDAQGGRPGVLLSLEAPAGIGFPSDHVDVAIADLSSRVLADRRRDFAPDSAGSYGADFSTADMLAGSAVGNVACRRVMADAGRAIGRALADLVTCLNPSLIASAAIPTPRPSRCSTASVRRSAATPFRPRSRRCPSPPEPSGSAPRCSAPWPS